MDRYEQLAVVGEGSYGLVMKCRHKNSGQIVAIKKFLETEEDANARKMAFREIRMLKRLRHENLISMIEVFRFRKRFYLVFEFVEGTILDELDKKPGGLGDEASRKIIFQVTRAIHFCHLNNVIHRDVKPENILVSSRGVVKLCDFGFARLVSLAGEQCTEYVATRWYRAPELLVGDVNYGAPVDIWAIGCLLAEVMTGNPLLPGESDIDQLYLTIRLLGKPCLKHVNLMSKTTQMKGMIKSADRLGGLRRVFHAWPQLCVDMLGACMKMDPQERITADELLHHDYYIHDNFPHRFLPVLREKVTHEMSENPLLRRFKRDVFAATDCANEYKKLRHLTTDAPRWKINLHEANDSIKRKFSCDFEQTDLSAIIANQRTDKTQTSQTIPITINTSSVNPSEIQMLEKTLESLNRLGQRAGERERIEGDVRNECEGTIKGLEVNASILHPMVAAKKSPLTSKHFVYLKKSTSNQTHDINLVTMKCVGAAPWLNSNGEKLTRRKEKRYDDLILPHLPGATMPAKSKHKITDDILQSITPRVMSSTSQKSASSKHLDSLLSFK